MLSKKALNKYFPYYKWGVYLLMLVNTGLFFFFVGNSDAGIENVFWIILLLIFEWQTSRIDKPRINRLEKYIIRALTLVCYLVVLLSAIHYSGARYISEWGSLDAWTAWTWLIVIAAIEYDVYVPGLYSRTEWIIRNGLKLGLYSALIVYIFLWISIERWIDAWDAFLWILCFFSIEMNIFAHEDELPYAEDVNNQPNAAATENST